ncbi:LPS biosynthesis protein [Thalassotalea insulae]|uniref:LPS biosynthesis protein n=1 Tax=Thalassotalea insulae TaxID=2056778 RepID=A0ABQ6GSA9_9GAMM|nr:LPS biosynthesis protein [Thalassotalea insulae]
MQKKYNNDELINLAELWQETWRKKFYIIAVCILFAICSIIYTLTLPNTYKASTLLSPVNSNTSANSLGGLANQLGSLASIAGINLAASQADKTALTLEILQSRSFIEKFIQDHNLLVPLMAAKNWEPETNTLIIDSEIYNESKKEWLRSVSPPKQAKPSLWEAYQNFLERIEITQDKTTSIINISIEYYSPTLAKQWLTWLITDINEFMRHQDQVETKASIDYLNKQLKLTQISNMENVFYQLIEEQTKSMMLIHVKSEYVLKTIDPAQVPDTKESPKRALIVIIGTMLGGFIALIFILVRYFTKSC